MDGKTLVYLSVCNTVPKLMYSYIVQLWNAAGNTMDPWRTYAAQGNARVLKLACACAAAELLLKMILLRNVVAY